MNEDLAATVTGLIAAQRLADARVVCLEEAQRRSTDIDFLYIAGMVCYEAGDLPNAARLIFQILEARPQDAAAYFHLGRAYMRQSQFEKAAVCYQKAIQLDPNLAEAYGNLGHVLLSQNRIADGIAATRRALELAPQYGNPHLYLAGLERRTDGAALTHSNLLFALSYNALCTPERLLEEHREWDKRHGGEGRAGRYTHERAGDLEKRLRVGYVSPDLKRHPVSQFLEPVLKGHDHEAVEVYCYAEVPQPDEVSGRLESMVDHWRTTVGRSDAQVARQIHEDAIDILVDLAGHTANNRLGVFTYKPAPVQVTYLGYCTTSGLEVMDYWVTDAVVTPETTVERTTETIWRLPRCWLSYGPETRSPEVAVRPGAGPVTFGSFNNISKLTAQVIETWAAILDAVPGSRLLLKTRALRDEGMCAEVRARFAAEGVAAERLELRGATPDYLAEYGEVDIALDPFPRTGGATTADALWMGVPVVTLAGERMIERQGASLLRAVGLGELIATDREDYIAKVVALARDDQRRTGLRAGLRARMAESELCDGRGLAAALETAYREMWQRYIET